MTFFALYLVGYALCIVWMLRAKPWEPDGKGYRFHWDDVAAILVFALFWWLWVFIALREWLDDRAARR
jgi:hypothetical protein